MENEEIVNRALKPTPTLMGLPEEIRLHLLNKYICHPQDFLTLRKVCYQLKNEIDFQIGIRSQITFSSSLEDPPRFSFFRQVSLRAIHINGSLSPLKILSKFEEMLLHPLKLGSLLITGTFWYKFLLENILQKCGGLVKLELHCSLLLHLSKTAFSSSDLITSNIQLPLLTFLSITTEPYPPRQIAFEARIAFDTSIDTSIDDIPYQKHCRVPFHFLQSLTAPRLQSFRIKIKYAYSVELDLLNLMQGSIVPFICRHGQLSSVAVSIDKMNDQTFVTPLQLVARISDNGLQNEEKHLQKEVEMFRNLQSLEEFHLHLESEEGHENLLELIQNHATNLKDFALKLPSIPIQFEAQLVPIIRANTKLTRLYIYCGFKDTPPLYPGEEGVFRTRINFCVFTECPNLEVISLHEYPAQSKKTMIRNVGEGLGALKQLRILILDGFILDGTELEELSRTLRNNASSASTSWDEDGMGSLQVLGIMKAALGFGAEAFLQEMNLGPAVTGVTFECFLNLITNRRLNGLLLDMDSICTRSLTEEMAVEKVRLAITGIFRTSFMEVSSKDCAGDQGETYTGWRVQLPGFTVTFDPYHE